MDLRLVAFSFSRLACSSDFASPLRYSLSASSSVSRNAFNDDEKPCEEFRDVSRRAAENLLRLNFALTELFHRFGLPDLLFAYEIAQRDDDLALPDERIARMGHKHVIEH